MDYKWYPTDKHVYGAIYREHYEDFSVFESFSNPEPSDLCSTPRMETAWGFKNADVPLIKLIQTKEIVDQKEWDCEYFIALVLKD